MSKESNPTIVLAFSGGLDTSFCVPYLIDQGYRVVTIFVDSGGVSESEKQAIEQRALSLGASEHREASIADALWNDVITPLIWGGHWYQNQYPLLCSDRYLIVAACLKLCDELNTNLFAHGCTGMGNDQVRFDLAVQCLGDYKVITPIREIQKLTSEVREYEKQYLLDKGYSVSDKVSTYSVNENLLGATISGSEIDQWKKPSDESYLMIPAQVDSNKSSQLIRFKFEQGTLVAFNGKKLDKDYTGEQVMQQLNQLVGSYGVGRGLYTGDTSIGLKGRIAFEAPALVALKEAHVALEQSVLSKAQNRFKASIAEKWTELVYEGFYYEPLKYDLEAFLESSQTQVTGEVTLELKVGQITAVEINSDNILLDTGAVYAQSASWTIDEAVGFIKLFGKSTVMASSKQRSQGK
ncbi:MAG: argininosuccinate synthase [Enterobacterales bacterium]|nr:argininosuccinate synthase [Enterobacterales bacterium]